MSLKNTASVAMLFVVIWSRSGETRFIRVPDEAPTVQAGLDSLAAGDTVWVAFGTYPEFLLAPALTFALQGEYVPDSGDAGRPLIDPSDLPAPDSMAVLRLPRFAHATIENLHFKNGLRQGIRSWADAVTLRNCIVDTVDCGYYQVQDSIGATTTLEDCSFRNNGSFCVSTLLNSPVHAFNCEFSGREMLQGWQLVGIAGSGSTFEGCRFFTDAERGLLYAPRGRNEIRDCIFGPVTTGAWHNVVDAGLFNGCFVNNTFQDCNYGSCIIHLWDFDPDSVEIAGNVFQNCHGYGPQANGAISLSTSIVDATWGVLVSGNMFVDCSGNQYFADDIAVHGGRVHITGNRFVRDGINGLPAIATWDSLQDSVILRDNLFEDCGYAVHGQTFVDARWNWWGDSTGPYHVTENPGGLGDTITGNVNFIPWQVDTSFLSVPDPFHPQASEFLLEAWPNPFNSSIRIILAGFAGRDFEITLHNLLGQVVDVIHRGPMTGGEITYQAPAYLASGVYFIRATDRIAVQTRKVVLLK